MLSESGRFFDRIFILFWNFEELCDTFVQPKRPGAFNKNYGFGKAKNEGKSD